MSDEPSETPEIIVPQQQLAGVWANRAQINYSEHEFTIEFIRMDPVRPRGILVARVS